VSVTELYEAYASGSITRGAFIRRLVGFGMTVPVATAYAAAVARPDAALAGVGDPPAFGLYGLYGTNNLYGLYDIYPPGP